LQLSEILFDMGVPRGLDVVGNLLRVKTIPYRNNHLATSTHTYSGVDHKSTSVPFVVWVVHSAEIGRLYTNNTIETKIGEDALETIENVDNETVAHTMRLRIKRLGGVSAAELRSRRIKNVDAEMLLKLVLLELRIMVNKIFSTCA
jgi:hypothetical protein